MVYGHDGFAGELGHVIVRRGTGRMCGCGRKGCLETYCSATGVARTAREFLAVRTDAKASPSIVPVNSKISCANLSPCTAASYTSLEDNLLNIYKGKTKLLVSELKDSDAAVLGASALAWELKDL